MACLVTAALLALVAATPPPTPPPPSSTPELYFLLMQGLNRTYNASAVGTVFARAAKAGYRGVVLYDANLEALGSPHLRRDYTASLGAVVALAKANGQCPFQCPFPCPFLARSSSHVYLGPIHLLWDQDTHSPANTTSQCGNVMPRWLQDAF